MKLVNTHSFGRNVSLFIREDDGRLTIKTDNTFYPFYYVYDPEGKYRSYDGQPLKKIIVSKPSDIKKDDYSAYGTDVSFKKQYMIHRVQELEKTKIKFFFIDIEVLAKELPDIKKAICPVSCITIYNSLTDKGKTWWLKEWKDEKKMLQDFCSFLKRESPDLLLAWNMQFDYSYLFARISNFAKAISPISQERYGDYDTMFPAGISVLDYMSLFKKVFMREGGYSLDYIAKKHLGEESWGESNFGELTDDIREKNVNDIRRMVKLERKYKIIDYFDEIRRMTKVQWEDLYHNSAIVEMLLFEEAKYQNIVLPNKQSNMGDESFEGATREAAKTGAMYDIGKYDLSSAYPQAIVNFCLDTSNIVNEETTEKTVEINGIRFKQNENALLPSIVKKILVLKDNLKKAVEVNPELKTKYDAIKAVVNSCFGVFGNKYFRLYDQRITSSITYLVREVLMTVKDAIEKDGFEVVYWDTDSIFVNSKENILDRLNQEIQNWCKKYGKKEVGSSFDYEGFFEKLFIVTKCRYVGYLNKKGKGKVVPEIKGVEIKRVSSSKFEAKFQEELIAQIFEKKNRKEIESFITEKKSQLRKTPLDEISFPCKLRSQEYKNTPINQRAVDNTKLLLGDFKVNVGEVFYYTYVKGYGYDKNNKLIDVLAFKKDENFIKPEQVDFTELERRNINSKTENIFEAMGWKQVEEMSLF